jgi:hypothetical protein
MPKISKGLQAVRNVARLATWHRDLPKGSALSRDGFRIVPELLTRAECESIRADFDRMLHVALPPADSDVYIVSERSGTSKTDRLLYRLMNYQRVAPWVIDRVEQPVLKLMKEETGLELCINSYSVQVDWPDTKTKRGLHNDGLVPTFKTFIYLSDVEEPQHGPYTVVPGSHRHFFRKLLNIVLNFVRRAPLDDMNHAYRDQDATRILGPAGTGILSCQLLAHKGWQQHTNRVRYVLVLYMRPPPARPEWNLGRSSALTSVVSVEEAGILVEAARADR